jgi:hypothetical protein
MQDQSARANERQLHLLESLLKAHGPLLSGSGLALALGHRSVAALRIARRRGQINVQLFRLPNRRGVFAFTKDVADWLACSATPIYESKDKEKTR